MAFQLILRGFAQFPRIAFCHSFDHEKSFSTKVKLKRQYWTLFGVRSFVNNAFWILLPAQTQTKQSHSCWLCVVCEVPADHCAQRQEKTSWHIRCMILRSIHLSGKIPPCCCVTDVLVHVCGWYFPTTSICFLESKARKLPCVVCVRVCICVCARVCVCASVCVHVCTLVCVLRLHFTRSFAMFTESVKGSVVETETMSHNFHCSHVCADLQRAQSSSVTACTLCVRQRSPRWYEKFRSGPSWISTACGLSWTASNSLLLEQWKAFRQSITTNGEKLGGYLWSN